jgi:hypothetical protein
MNITNWIEKNKKTILIIVLIVLVICIYRYYYVENFENNDKICCPSEYPNYLIINDKGKGYCFKNKDDIYLKNVDWSSNYSSKPVNVDVNLTTTECNKNKNFIVGKGDKCNLNENSWVFSRKRTDCKNNEVEVSASK